jgi:hypothetical protein
MTGEQEKQYVDTEIAAAIEIGKVGIMDATGSTISPMPATGGTVSILLVTASSGTTFAVTAGTAATLILASNTSRKSYACVGNAAWYLGFSTGLTTANGFSLAANQTYADGGQGVYTGEVYGIVSSGTANIRVIETW